MLKKCTFLFAALCTFSVSASDETTNRVLSSIARRLQFVGLVDGQTYDYIISQSTQYRIYQLQRSDYFATCTMTYMNNIMSLPGALQIEINGKNQESALSNSALETFRLLFYFYQVMPVTEKVDTDAFVHTVFKSGTFIYRG